MLVLDPTNGLALAEPGVDLVASGARRARGAGAPALVREAEALAGRRSRPTRFCRMPIRRSASSSRRRVAKPEAIASWKRAVALDAAQFNALYNLWSSSPSRAAAEAIEYGRQFVATAPPAFFADNDIAQRDARQILAGTEPGS